MIRNRGPGEEWSKNASFSNSVHFDRFSRKETFREMLEPFFEVEINCSGLNLYNQIRGFFILAGGVLFRFYGVLDYTVLVIVFQVLLNLGTEFMVL